MGTAVVFVERGAVVYKGSVASWWSGLSRTSTKPGVCVGFGCAAMRMSASGLCLLFIHPCAPNLINLRSASTMPA